MSARNHAVVLAENVGASTGADVIWPGGEIAVTAEGTVTAAGLEIKTKNGAYVPVDALQFTAAGMKTEKVPSGIIRWVVTTGTAVFAYGVRVSGQ